MLLLQAGMGGGVGSAVAPVVADIARRQGALTVAVAGMPRTLPARQAATAVSLRVVLRVELPMPLLVLYVQGLHMAL